MKRIKKKILVFFLVTANLLLIAKPKADGDSLVLKRHKIYLNKERVGDQRLLTLIQQHTKPEAVDKMTKEFNMMQTYKVQKKRFYIIAFATLLIPVISGGVISNMEGNNTTIPLAFAMIGGTVSISSSTIAFIYKKKLRNKQRDIVKLYNAP